MVNLVKIRKKARKRNDEGKKSSSKRSSKKTVKSRESTPTRKPRSVAETPGPSKSIVPKTAGKKARAPRNKSVVIETPVAEIVAHDEGVENRPTTGSSSVPEPARDSPTDRSESPEPEGAAKESASFPKSEETRPVEPETVVAPTPAAEERLDKFRETVGSSVTRARISTVSERDNQKELLTFIVAGEQYAVSIDQIVEIITPRSVTRVPNSAETTVGIISLRGTIVTLLDIRKLLGHKLAEIDQENARIVVVENAGETAGFLVDRVSRVIKIDPEVIESHPVVSSIEQSEFVEGVFRYRENLMILLDLEKLLSRER